MFHSSKFCMPTQMKESLHFHETLGDYGACTGTIQFSYQTNPPSLNTYTELIETETTTQRQQNIRTPLENHRKPASIRGSSFLSFQPKPHSAKHDQPTSTQVSQANSGHDYSCLTSLHLVARSGQFGFIPSFPFIFLLLFINATKETMYSNNCVGQVTSSFFEPIPLNSASFSCHSM